MGLFCMCLHIVGAGAAPEGERVRLFPVRVALQDCQPGRHDQARPESDREGAAGGAHQGHRGHCHRKLRHCKNGDIFVGE